MKFEWTSKCEANFQILKEMLTSALIQKIADLDRDFVVCTNASQQELGGVLTHDEHVIS